MGQNASAKRMFFMTLIWLILLHHCVGHTARRTKSSRPEGLQPRNWRPDCGGCDKYQLCDSSLIDLSWLRNLLSSNRDHLETGTLRGFATLPTSWRTARWSTRSTRYQEVSDTQVQPKVPGHLGGRRWSRWGQLQMLKWLRSGRWCWHSLHVSCFAFP